MNSVLFGILIYILFQLLLGLIVSRSIRTEDDYLLAGRKLGYGIATFSVFATWFGAESCIGTAGAAYAGGLAGVTADPFGYAICLLLMGLVFAVPLWNMKLVTIADFFRIRFSGSAERLTAIIMIPTSVLWAAAQIRAFGLVVSASSDLNVSIAVTAAAAVVIMYTITGGMLADAITDVVQGGVLIIGLVVLIVVVAGDLGGLSSLAGTISEESVVRPGGESGTFFSFLQTAEAWAIPICGSLIGQELISRVLASKSPAVARRSSLTASGMYLLVGLIPLTLGLFGFSTMPGLEHEEQILPMIAKQHLNTFLYIVFAGALISAILSTVDSCLLAASALLSHNIILPLIPQKGEKVKVLTERSTVFVMGILAYVLALYAEGVYNLVKDASSFGSAGIFVVFLLGLYTGIGGTRSAIVSLIVGAVTWIVGHYMMGFELSYLLALGFSLVVYLGIAIFDRPKGAEIPPTYS